MDMDAIFHIHGNPASERYSSHTLARMHWSILWVGGAVGGPGFEHGGHRPPLAPHMEPPLVKGHSRSLRVISFDRLCMVSY